MWLEGEIYASIYKNSLMEWAIELNFDCNSQETKNICLAT